MERSFVIILILAAAFSPDLSAEEEETASPANPRSIIELRTLDAEISPAWEIILPTGNIEIRTGDSLGGFNIGFQMRYNFIANTTGGSVEFSYPIWLLLPVLRFYQDIDFEKTADVGTSGNIITLNDADRYISRRRGIESGLFLRPVSWLFFGPALDIRDTYEGSIETAEVLDDSLYLFPAFKLSIGTLTLNDKKEEIYTGFKMDLNTSWRFKQDFQTPIEWDIRSTLTMMKGLQSDLFWKNRLQTGFPLKIWEKEMGNFYSLGGYDSVRGYRPSSIHVFRYAMLNTELKLPAFFRKDLSLTSRTRGLDFHRFRILLLADVLAGQLEESTESNLHWYAGTSAGASMLISNRTNYHLRLRPIFPCP